VLGPHAGQPGHQGAAAVEADLRGCVAGHRRLQA
jgi:hypothetical protein